MMTQRHTSDERMAIATVMDAITDAIAELSDGTAPNRKTVKKLQATYDTLYAELHTEPQIIKIQK